MTPSIQPLGTRVLLQLDEPPKQTKGGILLPDKIEKERLRRAKILAVGPGKFLDGRWIEMGKGIDVGAAVLVAEFSIQAIPESKELALVDQEALFAVLKE